MAVVTLVSQDIAQHLDHLSKITSTNQTCRNSSRRQPLTITHNHAMTHNSSRFILMLELLHNSSNSLSLNSQCSLGCFVEWLEGLLQEARPVKILTLVIIAIILKTLACYFSQQFWGSFRVSEQSCLTAILSYNCIFCLALVDSVLSFLLASYRTLW